MIEILEIFVDDSDKIQEKEYRNQPIKMPAFEQIENLHINKYRLANQKHKEKMLRRIEVIRNGFIKPEQTAPDKNYKCKIPDIKPIIRFMQLDILIFFIRIQVFKRRIINCGIHQ